MKKLKVCLSIALLLSTVGIGLLTTAFSEPASALPPICNCQMPKWEYGYRIGDDCTETQCNVE